MGADWLASRRSWVDLRPGPWRSGSGSRRRGSARETPATADLPPRPDPWTCRPLPPPAPWADRDADVHIPRRPQSLPPGRGPLVGGRAGFEARGVAAFVLGLGVVIAVVVALVGVDRLAAHPLDTAVYGTGLVGVAATIGWMATVSYLAGGVDWAADEFSWVDLYDLVAVRVARTRWGVPALQLTDGEGRRVLLRLRHLRAEAMLGRCVHLGIRWSRATNVVEIDDAARALLGDPT